MRRKTSIFFIVLAFASVLFSAFSFWQRNGQDDSESSVVPDGEQTAGGQNVRNKNSLGRRSPAKGTQLSPDGITDAGSDKPTAKDDRNSTRPAPVYDQPFDESLSHFSRLLLNTSPIDGADLRRLLAAARQVEETKLVALMTAKLSDTNVSLQERGNVIFVATKLNTKSMFPVWEGLLTRDFPAFINESSDWSKWMLDHRNEQLRLMQVEQLRALGGIGALQLSDETSREFMYKFALKEIAVPGDLTMLRFEAARQLQLHNKTSLLKLAKILGANDPLRIQLSVYADAKRGRK